MTARNVFHVPRLMRGVVVAAKAASVVLLADGQKQAILRE